MESVNMTWERWQSLPVHERERLQDYSDQSPQLTPWLGWRVEVVDMGGEKRRFIVGRSTGWKPIHLEVLTRRSYGGMAACKQYQSVRPLYKVR